MKEHETVSEAGHKILNEKNIIQPQKKNEMTFVATWMNQEIVTSSEVRQRQILYDIPYMWNLKKMIQMKLSTKKKQTQTSKTNLWLPKGEGVGERGKGIEEWIGSLRLKCAHYCI